MKKINKIIAVISGEKIFAIHDSDHHYPMVLTGGVDINVVIDGVQEAADFYKLELTIAEFTSRKDIKVIKPNDKH